MLVLLIASIPVALPAVMSVTMAIGAYALSLQKAIVARLSAIEELAGVDILCSNKTGTLTINQLTVQSGIPFGSARPTTCFAMPPLRHPEKQSRRNRCRDPESDRRTRRLRGQSKLLSFPSIRSTNGRSQAWWTREARFAITPRARPRRSRAWRSRMEDCSTATPRRCPISPARAIALWASLAPLMAGRGRLLELFL